MSGRSGKESKYEEIQAKKVMFFFFFAESKMKIKSSFNVVMT